MKPKEVVEYRLGGDGYQDVARYDARRYKGPANEYKQAVMARTYRRLVGDVRNKRVLDIGCGTGRGVIDFVARSASAVGCDASRDMLELASLKASRAGVRCDLVQAYAQQLPFADAVFDVVTALNFLHLFSLEAQREMVHEMKRVVREGGSLVLEFDNALQGLLLGLYKRWSGRERGSLPHEIRYVIGDGCRIANVHGAVFPVVWRILKHVPRAGGMLEKSAYFPPFNRFAHRVYYKVVKTDSM